MHYVQRLAIIGVRELPSAAIGMLPRAHTKILTSVSAFDNEVTMPLLVDGTISYGHKKVAYKALSSSKKDGYWVQQIIVLKIRAACGGLEDVLVYTR